MGSLPGNKVIVDQRQRIDAGAFVIPALDAAEEAKWRLTGDDPPMSPIWIPDHVFQAAGTGVVRSIRLRSTIMAVRPALRRFMIECMAQVSLNHLIVMNTNLLDLVEGADTKIKYRQGDSLQFRVEVKTEPWVAYSAILRHVTPPELTCALMLDCEAALEIA